MRRGMAGDRSGSNMAEAAVAMPVVLLVLMLAINASLAAYTAVAATNAVNYGARMGAITRQEAEMWAQEAAIKSWNESGAGGAFSCAVLISDRPNGTVLVTGNWVYPTLLSGLCSFFGESCPLYFHGTVSAMYRKEGY